jgi:hypothetical protein
MVDEDDDDEDGTVTKRRTTKRRRKNFDDDDDEDDLDIYAGVEEDEEREDEDDIDEGQGWEDDEYVEEEDDDEDILEEVLMRGVMEEDDVEIEIKDPKDFLAEILKTRSEFSKRNAADNVDPKFLSEFFDDSITKVPLEDDPDDPDYNERKKSLEKTVERRKKLGGVYENFNPYQYLNENITEIELAALDKTEINKQVDEEYPGLDELFDQAEEDLSKMSEQDLEKELSKATDYLEDDPHLETNVTDWLGTGISDDDIKALDDSYKTIKSYKRGFSEDYWNRLDVKYDNYLNNLESADNKTQYAILEGPDVQDMAKFISQVKKDEEMDEFKAPYDFEKWLIYDLDFNVTNLVLAATKYSPDAPLIFWHWLKQLQTYDRYQYVRDNDFNFEAGDVENADIGELERYYRGFGYDEIPTMPQSETGLIAAEEMDEEEEKMAAFEEWMREVYNPEWDRKDFDDPGFDPPDNVFSEEFVMPDHPDLPPMEMFEEDLQDLFEEYARENPRPKNDGNETEYKAAIEKYEQDLKEFKEELGVYLETIDYKPNDVDGDEFIEDFRGHLIVACGHFEADLDTAEKITTRMREEFGEKIYVETRIIARAREDDNVFEVWLESYEIDLLHSRRRNFLGTAGWKGPPNVDDDQLDYLVKEVRQRTSDEARLSFPVEELKIDP